MAELLVGFEIGPVQSFIAAARRTADLWYGSHLLSELARAGASALQVGGGKLIFPAPKALEAKPEGGVPHHLVAIVPANADPAHLCRDVEAAVRARLREVRDAAFGRVGWGADAGAYRAIAEAQVDDLLEVYWAAVPLHGDYPGARRRLSAALAARKATRTFSQVGWGSTAPKSSIDGQRESVIPEALYRGEAGAAELYRRFRARPAERLSGVDLLKRFGRAAGEGSGSDAANFPGTPHIAALPFLHRWRDDASAREAFRVYLERVRPLGVRGQPLAGTFYRPQLTNGLDAAPLFEDHLAEELEGEALASARAALADFFKATGGQRPGAYYALLAADGDSMGKVIDGQTSKEQHIELSASLAGFAWGAGKIVNHDDVRGALVYAGGDDVLALVPLDTAVACAARLAAAFAERTKEFKAEGGNPATLSVGIAIQHHIEPLSDALDRVRAALEHAKRHPGKHALAITLSKRSGSDLTIRGGFGSGFVAALDQLVDAYRHDRLPDGAAFELRELDRRLGQVVRERKLPPEALRLEALRVIARKRTEGGTTALGREQIDLLTGLLDESRAGTHAPDTEGQGSQTVVGRLAEWLIVARELARAAGPAQAPAAARTTGGGA